MMGNVEGSFAKMPGELIMKAYPQGSNWLPDEYDDTMGGVDKQIAADKSARASGTKPRKA